ncbi:SGNH/GDSL hydrolase family protein [Marinigracilibium pacificum]|uniref:SGNH/GDSL hydrolase family protein n=1 Tax=Marinigracilibium pacificum TaxID=2729599 RepID=A0A848J1X0_9BACT|nr:SGNH/GDSL hydrolase family protein [Marinigracilibium pacificum]NMM50577.1 SGNH/GDSL hydrolase family protein [Marinigracilibium pacificum]
MRNLLFIVLAFLFFSCETEAQQQQITSKPKPSMNTKYLALGDSYTIGEAVDSDKNFPNQLVAELRSRGGSIDDPKIIAVTGWTTDELKTAIENDNPTKDYGFVTLLIGVNNQYRGYEFSQYEKEFTELLNMAIEFASGDPEKVIVVSIPDYGVTPFAENSDSDKIARELDQYNSYAKGQALSKGVTFVDITGISRLAEFDPELTASDKLHPSGKMYKLWVDAISPAAFIKIN